MIKSSLFNENACNLERSKYNEEYKSWPLILTESSLLIDICTFCGTDDCFSAIAANTLE